MICLNDCFLSSTAFFRKNESSSVRSCNVFSASALKLDADPTDDAHLFEIYCADMGGGI